LPGKESKSVDIVAHTDTSGSISPKNISDYAAELAGMFTGDIRVTMTLLIGDADIHRVVTCTSREELLEAVSNGLEGGGGTSHAPMVKWILQNKPECKLFVSMTDGYSDIQNCYHKLPETCRKVLLLSGNDMASRLVDYVDDIIVID